MTTVNQSELDLATVVVTEVSGAKKILQIRLTLNFHDGNMFSFFADASPSSFPSPAVPDFDFEC
jgi:hypothetical protein